MPDPIVDSPNVEGSNPDLEAGTPDRPDWLPDNFNDPADLAKSWKDGQAALTRANQEAAAARAALEARQQQETAAQQKQDQQAQQTQDQQLITAEYEAIEQGDYARAAQLRAYRDDLRANAIIEATKASQTPLYDPNDFADRINEKLAAEFGKDTWNEIAPAVADMAKEFPNLVSENASVTETAKALAVLARAALQGRTPAVSHDQTAAKLAAQTMTGASVRQPAQPDAEWDKIANAGSTSYGALRSRG